MTACALAAGRPIIFPLTCALGISVHCVLGPVLEGSPRPTDRKTGAPGAASVSGLLVGRSTSSAGTGAGAPRVSASGCHDQRNTFRPPSSNDRPFCCLLSVLWEGRLSAPRMHVGI